MEMTGKRRKMQTAAVLALGLAIMLTALTQRPGVAYGAAGIETDRTCRITFTLDVKVLEGAGELTGQETAGYQQYYEELVKYLKGSGPADGAESAGNAIKVNLYRVASVNVAGAYTLLEDYRTVEGLEGVTSANSSTEADRWLEWAEVAAGRAVGTKQEDGTVQPPAGGVLTADGTAQIRLTDGKAEGTAEGLKTGLYLVYVEPVDTDYYRYSFVPYLISLPNNYYDPDDRDSSDEWIYGDDKPIYVGLKPERQDRCGNLVIEKKLTSYNETLTGASFVFEVKAVKENQLVYSDVAALVFGKYGTERVTLERIPAGAEVTVTEVYSGASYSPASDGAYVRNTVIKADEAVTVSFENKYDGHLRVGGTSVVNQFLHKKTEGPGSDYLDWVKLENGNNDGPSGN